MGKREILEQIRNRASIYNPYHTETFLCSIALFIIAVCLAGIAVFQTVELNNTHCQSMVVGANEYLSGEVKFGSAIQFSFVYDLPSDLVSLRFVGKLPGVNSVATLCGGDVACEDIETITCADADLPPNCGLLAGRIEKLDSSDVALKAGSGLSYTSRKIKQNVARFHFVIESALTTYTIPVGPMCTEP